MRCSELVDHGSEHCRYDKPPTVGKFPITMMHFIQSGKGYFNGRLLCAGQGFVANCGTQVEYYPDKDDPWYYGWVNFVDNAMLEELRTVFNLDDDMVFSFNTEKGYLHIINSFYDNYSKQMSHSSGMVLHDLRKITYSSAAMWYSLLALAATDEKCRKTIDKKAMRNQYVEKIKKRLNMSLASPNVSIQKIAGELHISQSYLRNIFFAQCGMSPQAYLINQRMERACHYLAGGDTPINEIAALVGYSDALYFSKLFHKHIGMSPLAYRNKMKTEENGEKRGN